MTAPPKAIYNVANYKINIKLVSGYQEVVKQIMEFEWDPNKSDDNLKKHGITFHEASTVFGDPLAITFNDPYHSMVEHRFLTFGCSRAGQLMVVVHTERHEKTRIISARRATRQERKIYEDG